MMLERRQTVSKLLARRGNALVIPGLGSSTYDTAAAGDVPENFYLWGAMGGAAMIGLGLALAQPERRVLVLTGDGEMLMGMGSLATIGVQQPQNLAIAMLDNGFYAETGMQQSHTGSGCDLVAVAKACRFPHTREVADEAGLERLTAEIFSLEGPLFARIAIEAGETPRVLPLRDGPALKLRFRAALGLQE